VAGRVGWNGGSWILFFALWFRAAILKESVGAHGHERVTVKTSPGSGLEVIEAKFFFRLLVRKDDGTTARSRTRGAPRADSNGRSRECGRLHSGYRRRGCFLHQSRRRLIWPPFFYTVTLLSKSVTVDLNGRDFHVKNQCLHDQALSVENVTVDCDATRCLIARSCMAPNCAGTRWPL
jgi:hypothetical protein